jgi:hypothetical protein
MWRPRGELQEALTVAGLTTLVALALMAVVAPQKLRAAWPDSRRDFAERAIRAELRSLAQAQERYRMRTGRYAYDLTAVPWRSGYNLFVRVRDADSTGFRAIASSGGTAKVACQLTVSRKSGAAPAGPEAIVCERPRP